MNRVEWVQGLKKVDGGDETQKKKGEMERVGGLGGEIGRSGEVSIAKEETGDKERNEEFEKSSKLGGASVILDDEGAHLFALGCLIGRGSIILSTTTVLNVVTLEHSHLVLEE